METQLTDLWQGCQRCTIQKRVSSIYGIGKTAHSHWENGTGPFPYITHKNQLKMNRSVIVKIVELDIGEKLLGIDF